MMRIVLYGLLLFLTLGSASNAAPGDDRAEQQSTDEQILNLTWDVSKKLEQVLREIEQLKDDVSHLKNRLIRLERKVDRHRHETRRQLR